MSVLVTTVKNFQRHRGTDLAAGLTEHDIVKHMA